MKFTLAEIRAIDMSLPSITRQPLPIKLSYRLAKLIGFCTKELGTMEVARKNLVKKYSEENPEEGGGVRVTPENETKFREEFAELLAEEAEFEFEPISLEEIGDVKVTPVDLFRLAKIIKEEKE